MNTLRQPIQQFIDSWPQERLAQAEELLAQYTAVEPGSIDGTAAIPVDAANETPETLDYALACYRDSIPTSSDWEIALLLNNRTGADRAKIAEMLAAAQDHAGNANLPVHALHREYPDGVTMGRIRSDLADFALLHPGEPWLMAGHDVDLRAPLGGYFDAITELARNEPEAVFFTSELIWDVEGKHTPAQVMRYWNWQRRVARKEPVPTDANVVTRLRTYAELRGFDHNVDVTKASETTELLNRGFAKFGKDIVRVAGGVPLTTSSRRVYAAIAAGRTPEEMTVAGRFGVHEQNERVRSGEFDPTKAALGETALREILDTMDAQLMDDFTRHGVTEEMRAGARERLGLPT